MKAEIVSSFPLNEKETEKGLFYHLSFSLLLQNAIVGLLNPYIAIYFIFVFVFLGRSITIYLGAPLLDMGGFQLAALINVILMLFLLIITLITFKQLNLGFIEPDLFKKTKKLGSV
ncbi:MAG: hypothetical protein ACTSRI_03080 [Promethearchaeota archaeon]